MADAAELANGTAVTFLGYLQRPIIPQQLGVVVDVCDTAYTTKACGILVERLATQVGTSGAVVFNEQGHVVGLNILGERDESLALALRLDEIRRIAEKAGVPWNIYTDAEELKFGERLGRAINGGDREKFKAVVAKRINLDRSYKFNDENSPYPPLAVAGWANQIDMAVTLIKSGARAHYGPAIGAAMAAQRYDALKIMLDAGMGTACPFNTALSKGDETSIRMILAELVGRLLAMGVPVDLRDYQGGLYGPTPFEAAIFGGNFQIARLLAKRGGSPLGYRNGKERIFSDLIFYKLTDVQQQQARRVVIELATDYCSKLKETQFSEARDFRIQRRNCENL
jgi:hypothetical protein